VFAGISLTGFGNTVKDSKVFGVGTENDIFGHFYSLSYSNGYEKRYICQDRLGTNITPFGTQTVCQCSAGSAGIAVKGGLHLSLTRGDNLVTRNEIHHCAPPFQYPI
jgi:hypothetical protein